MKLSEIEKTVLRCLAQGMQSKQIAVCIGRSKPTVESHVRLLYAKLNAQSRAQLVAIAIQSARIEIAPGEWLVRAHGDLDGG